jgi:hypothetical protein
MGQKKNAIRYHRIQWIWKFPKTFTSPIKVHKHGIRLFRAGKLTAKGCALARKELDEGTFSSWPQLEDLAKRKVGSFKCAWVNDADRTGFKERQTLPSDSVAVAYNK